MIQVQVHQDNQILQLLLIDIQDLQIAGISIVRQSSQTDLKAAILKSRDFFNKYYENKDLLKDLIYSKNMTMLIKNIYISVIFLMIVLITLSNFFMNIFLQVKILNQI